VRRSTSTSPGRTIQTWYIPAGIKQNKVEMKQPQSSAGTPTGGARGKLKLKKIRNGFDTGLLRYSRNVTAPAMSEA